MIDKLLHVLALLVLGGFLGILLLEVPRFDLTGLVVVTLVLVVADIAIYRFGRRR